MKTLAKQFVSVVSKHTVTMQYKGIMGASMQ
jgi:hypothetical protein